MDTRPFSKEEDKLLLRYQKLYYNNKNFLLQHFFRNRRPKDVEKQFNLLCYVKQCTKDRIEYIMNNQNISLFEDQKELNPQVISDDKLINEILTLTLDHIYDHGVSTIDKRQDHEASLQEKEIIWKLREKYRVNFKTIDRILFNVEGESMRFYNEYFSSKIIGVSFGQNLDNEEYLYL